MALHTDVDDKRCPTKSALSQLKSCVSRRLHMLHSPAETQQRIVVRCCLVKAALSQGFLLCSMPQKGMGQMPRCAKLGRLSVGDMMIWLNWFQQASGAAVGSIKGRLAP